MMLNKMPANTSIPAILTYLETATKWGARNRALFALRQMLRIKDISNLRVLDLVNPDLTLRRFFTSKDGVRFELGDEIQAEVRRYLMARFDITGKSLEPLLALDLNVALFPTQKRRQFSPNTLAQHFSYLDKAIHQRFQASKHTHSVQPELVSSVLLAPAKESPMTRLMTMLAGAIGG
jgi:hypothetical protein